MAAHHTETNQPVQNHRRITASVCRWQDGKLPFVAPLITSKATEQDPGGAYAFYAEAEVMSIASCWVTHRSNVTHTASDLQAVTVRRWLAGRPP